MISGAELSAALFPRILRPRFPQRTFSIALFTAHIQHALTAGVSLALLRLIISVKLS